MLEFKIAEYKFEVPTDWSQIKVGQYMNVINIKGEHFPQKLKALIIEAVTGVPYDVICNSSRQGIENIYSALSFLSDVPDFKEWKLPTMYKLGEGSYQVPQDLNSESFGQRIAFEQIIFPAINETGDILTVMDKAVAIYMQPTATGQEFDEKLYAKVTKDVRESLLIEAHPIAVFFFRLFKNSLKPKERVSHQAETPILSQQE